MKSRFIYFKYNILRKSVLTYKYFSFQIWFCFYFECENFKEITNGIHLMFLLALV